MKFYKICVTWLRLLLVRRICKDIISKLTWLKSGQIWVAEICFPISKFLYYLGCLFLLLNTKIWFTFPTTEIWFLTQPSNPTLLNMVADNHLNGHFLVTLLFILFVMFMTYEYFFMQEYNICSLFLHCKLLSYASLLSPLIFMVSSASYFLLF